MQNLKKMKKVFIDMPKVFEQYDKRGNRRVLRLKKTIHILCQSLRSFCKYLTKKLIAIIMLQSNLDSCIFISDKFICILYVDDLIFCYKDKSCIRYLAMILHDIGIDIEQKEDDYEFLGVNL